MAEEDNAVTLVAVGTDDGGFDFLSAEFRMVAACGIEAALNIIARTGARIVLLDGLEGIERIVEWDPGINVLVAGEYSTDAAVEAIRRGACDYLPKPLSPVQVRGKLGRLLAESKDRRQALHLDEQALERYRFEKMVGRSPQMLEVFARIRRVAPHYRTALITGSTGTGKELVAQALHNLSPAASHRFVVSNCCAIVETLFESELFGHVKGAFTGAIQDRAGLFEYANGGTVMLDEIGDMPLATQSKLLRFLQNHEIQRVGSSAARTVDVRVVAATNRDLKTLIAQKQFREDLYYRLSMVEIKLPGLLERKEDLPLLERHFVEQFAAQYNKRIAGLSRRAQALLSRHVWPGNVRELENVLGHACMMTEREFLDIHDLPEYLRTQVPPTAPDEPELLPLAELERRHARYVLGRTGGNKLQAAAILGISRATLYRILGQENGAAVPATSAW